MFEIAAGTNRRIGNKMTIIVFLLISLIALMFFIDISKLLQAKKNKPKVRKPKHIHLCSTCLTGVEALKLDKDSICPYIMSREKGKCPYFKENK